MKGLLLASGGIDSPVAGYMMIERGLEIVGIHFDNRPFLNALKNRGFYVGNESTSNYMVTFLSLSSSKSVKSCLIMKSPRKSLLVWIFLP